MRLATNVPCPRPSPGEFGDSDVSDTCSTTRPPKSGRSASMPESTTAMAGVDVPPFAAAHDHAAPTTTGHCWTVVKTSPTRAVVAESAVAAPASFRATTATRRTDPTSRSVATYSVPLATSPHEPPPASQRCQVISYVSGASPLHVPTSAVSVALSSGVPETAGGVIDAGATGAGAGAGATGSGSGGSAGSGSVTSAVAAETARPARTRTRSPRSSAPSVYVGPPAPSIA